MRIPSLERNDSNEISKRLRWVESSALLVLTLKRSSARVLTRLTFWPPGPGLVEKLNFISVSETCRSEVMQMWAMNISSYSCNSKEIGKPTVERDFLAKAKKMRSVQLLSIAIHSDLNIQRKRPVRCYPTGRYTLHAALCANGTGGFSGWGVGNSLFRKTQDLEGPKEELSDRSEYRRFD